MSKYNTIRTALRGGSMVLWVFDCLNGGGYGMLLNLNEIMDVPGGSIPFDYKADFRDLEINFSKPFVNPAQISGKAYNSAGVLYLEVKCDTIIKFDCDRCAGEVERPYTVGIKVILTESLENPDDIDNADVLVIEDATVDIDDVIRSAIILNSDMRMLCSPDCMGICPRCGKNLNEGECDCTPEIDPRLEKLKNFFSE
jgi:uncharacterized protein